MKRALGLLAVMSLLVLSAGSAMAQKVGTYSGKTTAGDTILLGVVKEDGKLIINYIFVSYSAKCTNPTRTLQEGWGAGLHNKVKKGQNTFKAANNSFDARGTLRFVNDNKVEGDVSAVAAVFVPSDKRPSKAQFCKSAKLKFTLKFQPPM